MTAMNDTFRSGGRGEPCRGPRGFTLFELLIVIGIIIMVAGLALPTMLSLLTSGSGAQAYNMLSGQLMVARAMAIQHGTYVGVHVQTGQSSASQSGEDLSRACYCAIVWIPPGTMGTTFELAQGYIPQRVPGMIAFGEITGDFVSPTSTPTFNLGPAAKLEDFTAFTIVFSPEGEVVKKPSQADAATAIQLKSDLAGAAGAADILWDETYANSEEGVRVITIFDHGEVVALPSLSQQNTYLKEHAQFLYVNTYTGRLSSRDTRNE